MALVTANNMLVRDSSTASAGYHNVFYDWVLSGMKSTLNNEFKREGNATRSAMNFKDELKRGSH